MDRDKRRFSDIMEEKANKLGKSWKEPGKKIKLVSRLSQSDVKDVKQEGMVHVTIYIVCIAFNKVVAPEKNPGIVKCRATFFPDYRAFR